MLVHDAARPLVSEEVIERVLAPLSEGWDGAVPGLPVADTLKRVGSDGPTGRRCRATGSTRCRRRRRSPPTSPARRRDGGDATDCAALVEAAGGRVKVVQGDPRLLKVTTADDLAKIASWL